MFTLWNYAKQYMFNQLNILCHTFKIFKIWTHSNRDLGHVDKHDLRPTNQIYTFFHGSRSIGQIWQISYICLLEKNFGNPRNCQNKNKDLRKLHKNETTKNDTGYFDFCFKALCIEGFFVCQYKDHGPKRGQLKQSLKQIPWYDKLYWSKFASKSHKKN